jgi:hypothetical protein
MPRYNNLSSDELELIRRFIEESDIDAIDNEMRELVEHWSWLLAKLPPQTKQYGRRPNPTPFLVINVTKGDYIFFSEHLLVAASHMPPALSQSAWVFAVVTSPAKAGPVKARAKANANVETSAFIDVTPLRLLSGAPRELRTNAPCSARATLP